MTPGSFVSGSTVANSILAYAPILTRLLALHFCSKVSTSGFCRQIVHDDNICALVDFLLSRNHLCQLNNAIFARNISRQLNFFSFKSGATSAREKAIPVCRVIPGAKQFKIVGKGGSFTQSQSAVGRGVCLENSPLEEVFGAARGHKVDFRFGGRATRFLISVAQNRI